MKAANPEVSVDIDVHRFLHESVGTGKDLVTGHNAGVVHQDVYVSYVRLHLTISRHNKVRFSARAVGDRPPQLGSLTPTVKIFKNSCGGRFLTLTV